LLRVKAQVASMDIVISVVVVLLLVATLIVVGFRLTNNKTPSVEYGGMVFTNIESIKDPTVAFLKDYRVDETKLINFRNLGYTTIKQYVLNGTNIGSNFDTCIFFLNVSIKDSTSQAIDIGGVDHIGYPGCDINNPCKRSNQTIVYAKPVLIKREIANMYTILCA